MHAPASQMLTIFVASPDHGKLQNAPHLCWWHHFWRCGARVAAYANLKRMLQKVVRRIGIEPTRVGLESRCSSAELPALEIGGGEGELNSLSATLTSSTSTCLALLSRLGRPRKLKRQQPNTDCLGVTPRCLSISLPRCFARIQDLGSCTLRQQAHTLGLRRDRE